MDPRFPNRWQPSFVPAYPSSRFGPHPYFRLPANFPLRQESRFMGAPFRPPFYGPISFPGGPMQMPPLQGQPSSEIFQQSQNQPPENNMVQYFQNSDQSQMPPNPQRSVELENCIRNFLLEQAFQSLAKMHAASTENTNTTSRAESNVQKARSYSVEPPTQTQSYDNASAFLNYKQEEADCVATSSQSISTSDDPAKVEGDQQNKINLLTSQLEMYVKAILQDKMNCQQDQQSESEQTTSRHSEVSALKASSSVFGKVSTPDNPDVFDVQRPTYSSTHDSCVKQNRATPLGSIEHDAAQIHASALTDYAVKQEPVASTSKFELESLTSTIVNLSVELHDLKKTLETKNERCSILEQLTDRLQSDLTYVNQQLSEEREKRSQLEKEVTDWKGMHVSKVTKLESECKTLTEFKDGHILQINGLSKLYNTEKRKFNDCHSSLQSEISKGSELKAENEKLKRKIQFLSTKLKEMSEKSGKKDVVKATNVSPSVSAAPKIMKTNDSSASSSPKTVAITNVSSSLQRETMKNCFSPTALSFSNVHTSNPNEYEIVVEAAKAYCWKFYPDEKAESIQKMTEEKQAFIMDFTLDWKQDLKLPEHLVQLMFNELYRFAMLINVNAKINSTTILIAEKTSKVMREKLWAKFKDELASFDEANETTPTPAVEKAPTEKEIVLKNTDMDTKANLVLLQKAKKAEKKKEKVVAEQLRPKTVPGAAPPMPNTEKSNDQNPCEKSDESDNTNSASTKESAVKCRPGRPKGALNKRKLEPVKNALNDLTDKHQKMKKVKLEKTKESDSSEMISAQSTVCPEEVATANAITADMASTTTETPSIIKSSRRPLFQAVLRSPPSIEEINAEKAAVDETTIVFSEMSAVPSLSAEKEKPDELEDNSDSPKDSNENNEMTKDDEESSENKAQSTSDLENDEVCLLAFIKKQAESGGPVLRPLTIVVNPIDIKPGLLPTSITVDELIDIKPSLLPKSVPVDEPCGNTDEMATSSKAQTE